MDAEKSNFHSFTCLSFISGLGISVAQTAYWLDFLRLTKSELLNRGIGHKAANADKGNSQHERGCRIAGTYEAHIRAFEKLG